jgi:hypothetical protein
LNLNEFTPLQSNKVSILKFLQMNYIQQVGQENGPSEYLNVLLGIIPGTTSVRCRDSNLEKVRNTSSYFSYKILTRIHQRNLKLNYSTNGVLAHTKQQALMQHGKLGSNKYILQK